MTTTTFKIPKMAELCVATCKNVRAIRSAIDDTYNAFLDAITTTTNNPINSTIGYGGFYGVSDVLDLSVYSRATTTHKTQAELHTLVFSLASAMCARNGYGIGTSRITLRFSGENCPFVLFRQDNANSYFRYRTYTMQEMITGIYMMSNYIEAFFSAFYHSSNEDVAFIGEETVSQIRAKIFDTNLRAGIPYLTKFYVLPTNIFRARQVLSYAQYILFPEYERLMELAHTHQVDCAECEEEGECNAFLELYDAGCEYESEILPWVREQLGGLGTEIASYVADPTNYISSTSTPNYNKSNPLIFAGADDNLIYRLPKSTTDPTQNTYPGEYGYIYSATYARKYAFAGMRYDYPEATFDKGNPNFVLSNAWSWLNSQKKSYGGWKEKQHSEDLFYSSEKFKYSYLYMCDAQLRKHIVPWVNKELQKSTTSYNSGTLYKLSYVDVPYLGEYGESSSVKIGTVSCQSVSPNQYSDYAGNYPCYYSGADRESKRAPQCLTLSAGQDLETTPAVLPTRSVSGSPIVIAAINTDGTLVRKYANSNVAIQPFHRILPFYLTEKYGVPRELTKGIELTES